MVDHVVDADSIAAAAATLEWRPPDPGEWEFDASHQTAPATATAEELFPESFRTGFTQCFARFGMPLSHMAVECVNGWSYISPFVHGAPRKGNGKPAPELLIKVLSRVLPSARRRAKVAASSIENRLGMREVERYEALRPGWVAENLAFQDVDVDAATDDELAEHVRRTARHLAGGFTLHFDLIGQAMPVGEYLVRTAEWGIAPATAAKAAFHGVVSSREAGERLDAIVGALGDVEVASLDQIRAHSPPASAALDHYLRHHGSWALLDDLCGQTLAELPAAVVQSINHRRVGRPDERQAIDAALAEARAGLAPPDVAEFDRLVSDAQRAYAALDDDSGILAAWPVGLARRAQLAAARRLADRGVLNVIDDVWVLRPAEIAGLLTGASVPSTDEIAARAYRRAVNAAATPPSHLGSPPSPPPDPSVFPEPVAHNVRHMFAFIQAKFGDESSAFGVGDRAVTGRAVVAKSADDAIARIEPGDVLVTSYTTPAYNAIMPLLAGVVTTAGGPNSHTAIVARELGVAAVIGLTDALDTIPEGSTVVVDPVAVSVTVAD